jgi:hypothetical protein
MPAVEAGVKVDLPLKRMMPADADRRCDEVQVSCCPRVVASHSRVALGRPAAIADEQAIDLW